MCIGIDNRISSSSSQILSLKLAVKVFVTAVGTRLSATGFAKFLSTQSATSARNLLFNIHGFVISLGLVIEIFFGVDYVK